tara:strand:- start:2084 stop:4330 length:2247 start_codon:yes stop_codon:yes gene_type:complete
MAPKRKNKSSDAPANLRPYLFHGVDIPITNIQSTGDCPFCDKPGHFGVKVETGQFRCVKCDESGNISTFLNRLWTYSKELTADTEYRELSESRGVPVLALKTWGLVKSITSGDWLLPMYNKEGKLANLSRWANLKGEWKLLSTPGQKMHPYGTQLLTEKHETVWVTEGPWDGMALWASLNTVAPISKSQHRRCTSEHPKRLGIPQGVMSPPGAGNFSEDWLLYLQHKKQVNIVFDNDYPKKRPNGVVLQPGADGQLRIIKLMSDSGVRPKSIRSMKWGVGGYDKKLSDGYDIRDLLTDHKAVKTIKFLESKLANRKFSKATKSSDKEEDQPTVEPIHRENFKALCKDWDEILHFTQPLKDTLGIMLAAMISTELQGEQIWLRIIGPPGAGKSTLVEAVSVAREYVYCKSIFTGFHSGFTGGDPGSGSKDGEKGRKPKDSSLIPRLNGKTFIIKDADTLLTMPNRDRCLAEMRDIYDGTSRAEYRNNKNVDYEDLRITMIICGTDELRELNRSSLGERFLDVEILGEGDRDPYLDRALSNTYQQVLQSMKPVGHVEDKEVGEDKMMKLKQVTYGLLKHLKTTLRTRPQPTMSEKVGKQLKALGQFMAYMRAKKGDDKDYRPRVELATRLVAQMVKLAICLAIVFDKKSIDQEVVRLIRKTVLDTSEGFQLDILRALAALKSTGMSNTQIEIDLNIPKSTAARMIANMKEFHIIEKYSIPNNSGQRGRHVNMWRLSDTFRKVWNVAIGKL